MKKGAKLPDNIELTLVKPQLRAGAPWTGYVHPCHIKPNPNQPREEFFEEDQTALEDSHAIVGQQRAIYVIPYEDADDPDIWFMIHDGERSWRSLSALQSEAVLVVFNPIVNSTDLDFQSFVANFGGRGHTHKETIKAVWKEIKLRGRSIPDFAKAVTRSEAWVRGYLLLHNLHPELKLLLDPPTPKKERLKFNLALVIARADPNEQIRIHRKSKGKSAKAAIREAQVEVGTEDRQGGKRGKKPSDYYTIVSRILRTTREDFDYLSHLPADVFQSATFNKEMAAAGLEGIVAAITIAYRNVTGRELPPLATLDPLAAVKLAAERRFGVDRQEVKSVDDLINGNGGTAAPTF